MNKHSDISIPMNNLKELFFMIEYKSGDKYIQSMKQYIVNPMAWFLTENICSMEIKSLTAELSKARKENNELKAQLKLAMAFVPKCTDDEETRNTPTLTPPTKEE